MVLKVFNLLLFSFQFTNLLKNHRKECRVTIKSQDKNLLWTQRDINNKSAWSLRLKFQDIQPVDGFNQNINAPVQTTNPLNYGGQIIDLGVGINIMLSKGSIGLEAYRPISNDLNGPQMGMNWGMQAGYQLSF